MRRYLGPLVLAVTALASLWFLQQRSDPPAPDPAITTATLQTTTMTTPTHQPPPTAAPSSPSPSPSPSPTSSSPPEYEATTLEPEEATSDQAPEPRVDPEDDGKQTTGTDLYLVTAEDFAVAFARPGEGVDPQQWWDAVAAFMSPRAVEVYSGVDPENVGYTEVVGPAEVVAVDAPAHLLRQVRVPTDGGPYLVSMETDEDGIMVTGIVREDQR